MSDEGDVNSNVGLIERVPSQCFDDVDGEAVAGVPDPVTSLGRHSSSQMVWSLDEFKAAFDSDACPFWAFRSELLHKTSSCSAPGGLDRRKGQQQAISSCPES